MPPRKVKAQQPAPDIDWKAASKAGRKLLGIFEKDLGMKITSETSPSTIARKIAEGKPRLTTAMLLASAQTIDLTPEIQALSVALWSIAQLEQLARDRSASPDTPKSSSKPSRRSRS